VLEDEPLFLRVLNRASAFVRTPLAVPIIQFLNVFEYLKSLTQKPSILKAESPKPGQPILVVALWKYGPLREDIKKLFAAARSHGFFVLAVNTGKGQEEKDYELANYFAQIPNFGRDFASYKFAMKTVYRNNWHKYASRLVLANDSIFYSEVGLGSFLGASLETKLRALGATENFEIERHLGSFFVSFDPTVFQHKRFIRFWMRYRRTNIRPSVIRRGELRLSKTVKKLVDPSEFGALYDVGAVSEKFDKQDFAQADKFFSLSVRSPGAPRWRKSNLPAVAEEWRNRYSAQMLKLQSDTKLSVNQLEELFLKAVSLVGLVGEIRRLAPGSSDEEIYQSVREIALESMLLSTASGSQIHNSCLFFFDMGLPIVKLDLLYRGSASFSDILKFQDFMSYEEFLQLRGLIFQRPFGGDTLSGWRLAAFYRGLI
jgi:hypothetical protein